jgi:hypothetical protein
MSELDDRGSPRPSTTGPPPTPTTDPQAPTASGPQAWAPAGRPESWPPLPLRLSGGPGAATRSDLVAAVVLAVVIAALGAPLALLWSAVGPHVQIVMVTAGHPDLADYNTEAFVAGDGSYGLIGLAAGLVAGVGAWGLRRWRGPVLLVALAGGSLAGAWITWELGAQLGRSEYRDLLAHAAAGRRFAMPMELHATGMVYLQAITAVVVYVVHAAWSRYPTLGAGAQPGFDPSSAPQDAADPWGSADPEAAGPAHPAAVVAGSRPGVSSTPSAPGAPPAAPAPPSTETASSPPA